MIGVTQKIGRHLHPQRLMGIKQPSARGVTLILTHHPRLKIVEPDMDSKVVGCVVKYGEMIGRWVSLWRC